MSIISGTLAHALGLAISGATCVYGMLAVTYGMSRGRARECPNADPLPAVTILKPLCGKELELYEQLRSFCSRARADTQIVFGVHDAQDPAVSVVQRLQREFPHRDLELVIDRRMHGTNRKVSNLINSAAHARHAYLVIADSDVRVPEDYLQRVVSPLLDAKVGVVTCLYRARPGRGVWSALGALFIDEWFIPAVRVAAAFGSQAFTSGATIAIRRDVLAAAGGFEALANRLADDFDLGERVRRLGLRTILADIVVDTTVDEATFASFADHHLRWLRTIRSIQPIGYAGAFVTMSLPAAALGVLLAGADTASVSSFTAIAVARVILHLRAAAHAGRRAWRSLWLVPVHDFLTFSLWCTGFLRPHVIWRESRYRVERDGSLRPRAAEDPRC